MAYRNLTLEPRNGIAIVTIDRPKALNALNHETLSELEAVVEAISADGSVGGLILTGAGEKAFVAGADIKELAQANAISAVDVSLRGQAICRAVETMGKPVVAAVNGFALGGGLELALACHLRVASQTAKLGLPEVKLGVIPGYGGTQRLSRIVGRGRALEMILTGTPISAEEAHRIGLVNRVVAPAELIATAEELLKTMLANGPLALKHALMAVDKGLETDLESGLALEACLFAALCGSEDMREGMQAFLSKRAPDFKGK